MYIEEIVMISLGHLGQKNLLILIVKIEIGFGLANLI
jgi:hypothetical protein